MRQEGGGRGEGSPYFFLNIPPPPFQVQSADSQHHKGCWRERERERERGREGGCVEGSKNKSVR